MVGAFVKKIALSDRVRQQRWIGAFLAIGAISFPTLPATFAQQAASRRTELRPLVATASSLPQSLVLSPHLAAIYTGDVPKSIGDLQQMSAYQQALVSQVTPTTVAVQVGATQGSGVIITPDGYVLTAAHVAHQPGLQARLILSDGRMVRGTILGMNKDMDAGMIKIDATASEQNSGPWPFAPMGSASVLKPGSWCLALGHAGGYQKDRGEPAVRFGRILAIQRKVIETDCTLVGGDSGGPLFDMQGKVIGIHSRIGNSLAKNMHVPVDTFRQTWDRLADGQTWGSLLSIIGRPIIGVYGPENSDDPRIGGIMPGSPAEYAGLKTGDVITTFAGRQVKSFTQLKQLVDKREPGDEVVIQLKRNGQTIVVKLVMGGVRRSSISD